MALHRIVIVGGGAAGLELATSLGDSLGRKGKAEVTLIDKARSHVWKPKLHEIAAGSMDVGLHEVSYRAQAHWHGFRFRVGELTGIDRERREVHVAPVHRRRRRADDPRAQLRLRHAGDCRRQPEQRLRHAGRDRACAQARDDGRAGRSTAAWSTPAFARMRSAKPWRPHQLHVAIIGAGATGVELAAELHRTTRELVAYGLDRINPDRDLQLHADRGRRSHAAGLPERLSTRRRGRCSKGCKCRCIPASGSLQVLPRDVCLARRTQIPAELIVWAAGIKAPDFLRDIDGLETNRINQLVVRPTLQTTRDADIFAIGDCAACPWPGQQRQGRHGAAARPGGAPAGHVGGRAAAVAGLPGKPLTAVPLPRLRVAGIARRVQHRRQHDGRVFGGSMMIEGLVARRCTCRSTRCTSSRCTASRR